jgi:hypothetical protein
MMTFKLMVSLSNSSNSPPSDTLQGAPECFRPDGPSAVRMLSGKSSADVWSLGAVLSETAVWIGKGYNSVHEYRQERANATQYMSKRLGNCFHDGRNVLSTVLEWHDSLAPLLQLRDGVTLFVVKTIQSRVLVEHLRRIRPKDLLGLFWSFRESLEDASATSLGNTTAIPALSMSPTSLTHEPEDIIRGPPSLNPLRLTVPTTFVKGNERYSSRSESSWDNQSMVFSERRSRTSSIGTTSSYSGDDYDTHVSPITRRSSSFGHSPRTSLSQPSSADGRHYPKLSYSSNRTFSNPQNQIPEEETSFRDISIKVSEPVGESTATAIR